MYRRWRRFATSRKEGSRDWCFGQGGSTACSFAPIAREDGVREAIGIRSDEVVVSYVSRIAPEKNVAFLADALSELVARRSDVRLLFVGDGPDRATLEARLAGKAVFAGYRSGEDLADHYSAGDVFAFASKTETFGNVVLEAMASGMPVVALAAGGVGDTVRTGKNGVAVDPEASPTEFSKALEDLCREENLRRTLSAGALEHARSQSWSAIMEGLRNRYQKIAARRLTKSI